MSVTPSDHSTENVTRLNVSGEPAQSFETINVPVVSDDGPVTEAIEDIETNKVPSVDNVEPVGEALEDAATSKVPAKDGLESAGVAITEIETGKVPASSPPMYRGGPPEPVTQPIK